jgi:hypothetical protein
VRSQHCSAQRLEASEEAAHTVPRLTLRGEEKFSYQRLLNWFWEATLLRATLRLATECTCTKDMHGQIKNFYDFKRVFLQ